MTDEFTPLTKREYGLTTCVECGADCGMIEGCCVRSAVMGLEEELYTLFDMENPYEREDRYYEIVRKWFPVYFENGKEDKSGKNKK